MFSWRLTTAWLGLVGMSIVSAAGLAGGTAPSPALAAEPLRYDPVDRSTPVLSARRASDGLFYATLTVNDKPVRFLIDTGATHVVLNGQDARRIGDGVKRDESSADLVTAGGVQAGQWVRLDKVESNGAELDDVAAIVTDNSLPISLLGQNVLAKLGDIHIDGDVLSIRRGRRSSRTL